MNEKNNGAPLAGYLITEEGGQFVDFVMPDDAEGIAAYRNAEGVMMTEVVERTIEARAALTHQAEPVAWVRYCSDGGIEGPILNNDSRMCETRRSVWTPLYAASVALTESQIDAIRHAITVLNHYSMAPDSINAVSERVLIGLLAASPADQVEDVREPWILVEDRLPGEQGFDSSDVLCFINGHCSIHDMECRQGGAWGIRLGFYDAEKGAFRVHGRPEYQVTHWAPLPDAPAMSAPEKS